MDQIQRAILEELLVLRAEVYQLRPEVEPEAAKAADALLEQHRLKIRAWIATTFPTAAAAVQELPAACQAESDEHCARQNPEALLQMGSKASGTYQRMCKGCGEDPQIGG